MIRESIDTHVEYISITNNKANSYACCRKIRSVFEGSMRSFHMMLVCENLCEINCVAIALCCRSMDPFISLKQLLG